MHACDWQWHLATGTDVPAIKNIAQGFFQNEIQGIFVPDPIAYMRNVTGAIVNQYYSPGSEFVRVAKDPAGEVLGYVWVKRGQRAPWSDEEMAMVQMVHVDLTLSVRQRIAMIKEMIMQWEMWCIEYSVGIVCSTTMRGDQTAFLRIHTHMGYDVRGSYAYKRLGTTQAGLPIP